MGKWSLENTNMGSMLNYVIDEGEVIDTVALGMLTHNNINGFLPMSEYVVDGVKCFKYNLKSMVPLNKMISGVVNRKQYLTLISGIAKVMMSCDDYMIEFSTVMLENEYIYINAATNQPGLICLPIERPYTPGREKLFLKELTISLQFNQSENCDYIAKIISVINNGSGLDFSELHLAAERMLNENGAARNVPLPQAVSQGVLPQNQPNQQILPQQPSPVKMQQPVQTPPSVNPVADHKPTPPVTPVVNQQPIPPVNHEVKSASVSGGSSLFGGINIPGKTPAQQAVPSNIKTSPKPVGDKSSESEHDGKKGLLGSLFGKKDKKAVIPQSGIGGIAIPGQPAAGGVGVPQPNVPAENINRQAGIAIPGRDAPVDLSQNKPVYPTQTNNNAIPQPAPMPSQANDISWADEATVMIFDDDPAPANKPYLMSRTTSKIYYINNEPYKIGKKSEVVNLFINVPTVSRVHAIILTHGDDYYIMDNNSSNHTYMNGVMLEPNREYKLENKALLRFHKEEFTFYKE